MKDFIPYQGLSRQENSGDLLRLFRLIYRTIKPIVIFENFSEAVPFLICPRVTFKIPFHSQRMKRKLHVLRPSSLRFGCSGVSGIGVSFAMSSRSLFDDMNNAAPGLIPGVAFSFKS